MWTETTRSDYDRRNGRYSTDLTDKEFSLIEGMLPARKRLGRPREVDFREVVNAILYMLRTGCDRDLSQIFCYTEEPFRF